jgi:adenylosuccinate synthase
VFGPDLSCLVVVGAQWGDEGKGKLVDVLAEQADLVVRYQGGANAGHTVVIGDSQFILRLIPSGILNPGAQCLLGNGVVLDPAALFEELDALAARGVATGGRLLVSAPPVGASARPMRTSTAAGASGWPTCATSRRPAGCWPSWWSGPTS